MKPALIAALLLCGCAGPPRVVTRTKTVRVKVPVYRRAAPPAWLLAPALKPAEAAHIFTAPDDKKAVLGVTKDGLAQFYRLLDRLTTRLQAWRAWAVPPRPAGMHPGAAGKKRDAGP